MSETQKYQIEAWLGDDHGLTDEQVNDLTQQAEDINQRYPDDPDDRDDREAALAVAYRLIVEDTGVVIDDLAAQLTQARIAEARALAGIRQAALTLVPGSYSQAGFARRAGVDRMAVRSWTEASIRDRASRALQDAGFDLLDDVTLSEERRKTWLTLDIEGSVSTRYNAAAGVIEALAKAGLGVAKGESTLNMQQVIGDGENVEVYELS